MRSRTGEKKEWEWAMNMGGDQIGKRIDRSNTIER